MRAVLSKDAQIDEEAAEWVVNIKDIETWRNNGLLPEDFLAWVSQSKRHGDAFFNMARTWRNLDRLYK